MYYISALIVLLLIFPFLYHIRSHGFWSILFLFFIFLLFAFNRQNHDYEAYIEIFNSPAAYAEPGYAFLVSIVKYFGGNHEVIVFMLGTFVLVTFTRVYYVFEVNDLSYFFAFLFFYFLFPMAIEIIQIRSTFAFLIFLNAIMLVFQNKPFMSFFVILAAPFFHLFGLIYIIIWIYFVLDFYDWKMYKKLFRLSALLSFTLVFLIPKLLPELDGLRTLQYYISLTPKFHSFIFWSVPYLIDMMVFTYFYRRCTIYNEQCGKDKLKYLISLFYVFSLFMPFILYIDEFNRFFRACIIFKYIIFMVIAPRLSFNNKLLCFLYVLFFTLIYGVYYFLALDYDYVFFGVDV